MSDYNFTGKRIVVTGGATGVGAALLQLLAELGASDVTVLDIKAPSGPHSTYLQTNLADRSAIDAAVRQINGPVDVLFNNAGVADTQPREVVLSVNVLAPIHLTNALAPQFWEHSTVAITASIAGMRWSDRIGPITELLSLDGWDAMFDWLDGRTLGTDPYTFSKEVMQVWTMRSANALMQRRVRINSICPSPIDTPLLADFRKTIGDASMDFAITHAGGRLVSAREVASALAWVASPASSFVSGQNINIDFGLESAMVTGTLDMSTMRRAAR
jgi:NAD(P)-dependent dehydrogenase (short-subunit alcohol dehydrogenase family)